MTASATQPPKAPDRDHADVYKFVAAEQTTLEFTTADLAGNCPPLMIAQRLAQAGVIDKQTERKLALAFQEAVANACDHGNLELESVWKETMNPAGVDRYTEIRDERLSQAEYAARRVKIVTTYGDGKLVIRVSDEGPGFAPEELRFVQTDELLSSGRGLALISRTMDRVWHERNGREIIMIKSVARLSQGKE